MMLIWNWRSSAWGTDEEAKVLKKSNSDNEQEEEENPKKKSKSNATFHGAEASSKALTAWRTACLNAEENAKSNFKDSQRMLKEFGYVLEEAMKMKESEMSKDAKILLPTLRIMNSRHLSLELVMGTDNQALHKYLMSIHDGSSPGQSAPIPKFLDLVTLGTLQEMGEDAIRTIRDKKSFDTHKLAYAKQQKAISDLISALKQSVKDVGLAREGVSRVRNNATGGTPKVRADLHEFVADHGEAIPQCSDPLSIHEKECLDLSKPFIITSVQYIKNCESSMNDLHKASLACESKWNGSTVRTTDRRGTLKIKNGNACDELKNEVFKMFPPSSFYVYDMNDVAVESDGNLRAPNQASLSLIVHVAHDMCGQSCLFVNKFS